MFYGSCLSISKIFINWLTCLENNMCTPSIFKDKQRAHFAQSMEIYAPFGPPFSIAASNVESKDMAFRYLLMRGILQDFHMMKETSWAWRTSDEIVDKIKTIQLKIMSWRCLWSSDIYLFIDMRDKKRSCDQILHFDCHPLCWVIVGSDVYLRRFGIYPWTLYRCLGRFKDLYCQS